jgi:hypothetical protein
MPRGSARLLGLLAVLWLPVSGVLSTEAQENSPQPPVEIEGLSHEYLSCALVQFSIRNISQLEVYLEVYAEEFKSNAWTDVDYSYDLRDPRSRYIKRVMLNPDMTQTGATVNVKYDRCLRPDFVKQTDGAYVNAIKQKDKKAGSPVLQRLRVDVYVLDQGHIKRVTQYWSQPFVRVPESQPNQTPKPSNSSTPD